MVFDESRASYGAPREEVPCYWCVGCRVSRAGDWSVRIHHEAMLHEQSCFLTLTYSDEFLPDDMSVSVVAAQKFMRRLRKKIGHGRVRFFLCGEYGGKTFRPHYHVILFGYDFPDKVLWRRTKTGYDAYRSALLESIWPYGISEIGSVTVESAGYVARYVLKKVNGEDADEHYTRLNPLTGEVKRVRPEFITMSRRPGIGGGWFDQFAGDAFPSDFVVINGSKKAVPKYYVNKLPDAEKEAIKAKRKLAAEDRWEDSTVRRLNDREESLKLKLKQKLRELEAES